MRRRLRRRLFWAGVLLGLVLLYVRVSILRVCLWARDVFFRRPHGPLRPDLARSIHRVKV